MLIILLTVFVVVLHGQSPFTQIQSINGSYAESSFTLANDVLIIKSEQNLLQVFEGSQPYEFSHQLTLTETTFDRFELTANGEYLFWMNDNGLISIFSKAQGNYTQLVRAQVYFKPNQNKPLFSLSDDLWMAVVNNDMRQVRIYKILNDQPILQQIIAFLYPISQAQLSRDHSLLVIGLDGFDVLVYGHDGSQFVSIQSITFTNRLRRSISITEHHGHLAIGPANFMDEFIVYRQNKNKFQQYTHVFTTHKIEQISLSNDGQWITIQHQNKLSLYKSNSQQLYQELADATNARFSSNGKQIVVNMPFSTNIYQLQSTNTQTNDPDKSSIQEPDPTWLIIMISVIGGVVCLLPFLIVCLQKNCKEEESEESEEAYPASQMKEEIKSVERMREKNMEKCGICEGADCDCYLGCNHYYHSRCIEKWIESERRCAICSRSTLQIIQLK